MPVRTWRSGLESAKCETWAPFGAAPRAAPAGAVPNAQNGGALLLSELGELEPFYVLLRWSRQSYKMQLYVSGADGATKCSSMCSGSSLTRSPPKRGLLQAGHQLSCEPVPIAAQRTEAWRPEPQFSKPRRASKLFPSPAAAPWLLRGPIARPPPRGARPCRCPFPSPPRPTSPPATPSLSCRSTNTRPPPPTAAMRLKKTRAAWTTTAAKRTRLR